MDQNGITVSRSSSDNSRESNPDIRLTQRPGREPVSRVTGLSTQGPYCRKWCSIVFTGTRNSLVVTTGPSWWVLDHHHHRCPSPRKRTPFHYPPFSFLLKYNTKLTVESTSSYIEVHLTIPKRRLMSEGLLQRLVRTFDPLEWCDFFYRNPFRVTRRP